VLVVSSLLLASGVGACTELAPGSDTLSTVIRMNLGDAGPVGDARWACLDEAPAGGADRLVPSVELELPIRDIVSGRAPDGLSARACAKIDVNCGAPLAAPTGVEVDGAVHLQVPQGFDGYVELTSPTTVPTMFFLNRELMRDASEALNIIGRDTLAALAARGNVTLDPLLGHLLIRTFDCAGAPASGVQVSNSVGGLPFAFIDGLPVAGSDTTSAQGLGGFVNVPLGYAVLQGVLVEGSRLLATSNVVVREGWLSYGDVEPLPQ
jgi:hypothetical protein